MFIYNSGSFGANIFQSDKHDRIIPKKVVNRATSAKNKSKISKRNLKFLQALGLKVKI